MDFVNDFKTYLLSQKPASSKATVKNYLADIKKFILWFENTKGIEFEPSLVSNDVIEAFKSTKSTQLSSSSIDRHLSSLKKFFFFLNQSGKATTNPFEASERLRKSLPDPWHIKEFRNFLYASKASRLTIKNYAIDVMQFQAWLAEVIDGEGTQIDPNTESLKKISNSVIQEYSKRLLQEGRFSPATVNRKLSSLRKYLAWAASENLLTDSDTRVPANVTTNLLKEAVSSLVPRENIKKLNEKTYSEANQSSIIRETKYSSFPPLRLSQKTLKGLSKLLDFSIIIPAAILVSKIKYLLWLAKGKPLFVKKTKIITNVKPNPSRIKNIPKAFFNPLGLSLSHYPWYKKLFFRIKYAIPFWFRKQNNSLVAKYFAFTILLIFFVSVGYGLYRTFFISPSEKNPALAELATAPPRILSFHGRLTDKNNNPITANTNLRFAVYNSPFASGSALLWQEVDNVAPLSNGNFSTYLGTGTNLPQALFMENNALWIGVSVGSTPELTPRQQIATVAYASNAQTLQGLPLLNQAGSTQNVVLALDSSGNLSIGASTIFRSSSGEFAISGNTVTLKSNSGTNGTIAITPNGSGKIDLNGPIQSNALYNNIPSAAGAVEIDDLLAILATSSGQSALTLSQNGSGPIISASHSGTAVFTVDAFGNTTAGGNIMASTVYTGNNNTYYINNNLSNLNSLNLAQNLSVSGNITSNLVPNTNNTYDIGTQNNQWKNIYASNIYQNGQSLVQYFQRNGQEISPLNSGDDFLIGGNDPSSASWQVYGTTNGVDTSGTASSSGGLSFRGTSTNINQLNGGSLSFNTSPSGQGDDGLSTKMILTNSGDLAIGTTSAQALLTLGSSGSLQIGQNSELQYLSLRNNNLNFNSTDKSYISQMSGGSLRLGIGDISSNQLGVTINPSNFVGIDTTSPNFPLDVQSTISHSVPVGTCFGYLKNNPSPTGQYCGGTTESVSANFLGSVYTSGEFHSFSDERAKNFLENLSPTTALQAVSDLRPLHFQWKPQLNKGSQVIAGFFAQDVASVIPEAVSISQGQYFPDQESLDYNMLVTYAISAIQGLNIDSNSQQIELASQSALLSNISFTQTGDINITDTTPSYSFSIPHYYTLSDALGSSVTQLGAFLQLTVGDLKAGSINAQQLLTSSLAVTTNSITVSGQSLASYIVSVVTNAGFSQTTQSPIAEVDQIHTNVISPLSQDSQITIRLNNSRIDIAKDGSSSAVASIDNNGNATFSGTLKSQNLAINSDATISGTLHAGKIVANDIEGLQTELSTLSAQKITNVTNIYYASPSASPIENNNITGSSSTSDLSGGLLTQSDGFDNISSFSGTLSNVPTLNAEAAKFDQGILALGPSSFSDTAISGSLSVGSQLSIASTSINVLGGDLLLQPLRQGGISFVGGLVAIDPNGNLTVDGKAIFNDTLAVKTLSPLAGDDLTIQLGDSSSTLSANSKPQLSIKNASGSGVFAVNQFGDVVASGEATISKLNFNLIQPALAVSATEVVATGSAGTAKIGPHETQLTIDDVHVTANSLIYITPVGRSNAVPYLLRQIPGVSFTVGIPQQETKQTTFNWLIVN